MESNKEELAECQLSSFLVPIKDTALEGPADVIDDGQETHPLLCRRGLEWSRSRTDSRDSALLDAGRVHTSSGHQVPCGSPGWGRGTGSIRSSERTG